MSYSPRTRRGAAWTVAALLALAALPACGGQEAVSGAGTGAPAGAARSASATAATKPTAGEFRALEREFDARLGVYALRWARNPPAGESLRGRMTVMGKDPVGDGKGIIIAQHDLLDEAGRLVFSCLTRSVFAR